MVDILDSAHSYSHSALSKITRRKNSPKKKESETVLSARVTEFGLQFDVRKPIRSTITKLLVVLEKTINDSRAFMTAEFRSNQAKIKNQFNEMQSKLEVLMMKVNEVEEQVSDIEDKLMAKKESEEKREKQLKDHEERLKK